MKTLNRVLRWEMRSLGSNLGSLTLIVSAPWSTASTAVWVNFLADNTFICYLAGFLLFWGRCLLVSLHGAYKKGEH